MAPKESCMLRASQKDSLRVIVKLTLRFSVCLSLQKGPSLATQIVKTDDNQTNLIDHLSLKKADLFKKNSQNHF